jgi:hypothetical protein
MPTAKEYRREAQECVELAKVARDQFAKQAMAELAEEFNKAADALERKSLSIAFRVTPASLNTSRAFPKFESYGTVGMPAFCGHKSQDSNGQESWNRSSSNWRWAKREGGSRRLPCGSVRMIRGYEGR